jgi:hypothetical protein
MALATPGKSEVARFSSAKSAINAVENYLTTLVASR